MAIKLSIIWIIDTIALPYAICYSGWLIPEKDLEMANREYLAFLFTMAFTNSFLSAFTLLIEPEYWYNLKLRKKEQKYKIEDDKNKNNPSYVSKRWRN